MMNTNKRPESSQLNYQTPMMQQYADIKKQYPDCLLFFRLGDFYELFLEDAEIGSKILEITLTARSKGKDGKIPMCGVPYHALNSYLAKITRAGHKAAICEQVSDPSASPGIVEREVIRIITPGTITDENLLQRKNNNFTLTLTLKGGDSAYAYADLSTGQFFAGNIGENELLNEVAKINPTEIILPPKLYENYAFIKKLRDKANANIFTHPFKLKDSKDQINFLKAFFQIKSLKIFDIPENSENMIFAASNLLEYLDYTQQGNLKHIKSIKHVEQQDFLRLDAETIKNLEIFESGRTTYSSSKTKSLFTTIDYTKTAMGGRLLGRWLSGPLTNISEIKKRQDAVSTLCSDNNFREDLQNILGNILDIERLLAKTGTGTANPRDIAGLGKSLKLALDIKYETDKKEALKDLADAPRNDQDAFRKLRTLITEIDAKLVEDPPATAGGGGLIKEGVDQKLDDIKDSISESKEWIAELEGKEKKRTGISSLKVGFNNVYGYYIEISKANSKSVPENYIRKQTLVNAERYITDELKYKEEIVLNAQEKINEIEFEIFRELIAEINESANHIQLISHLAAVIDVAAGFAELAVKRNYRKPEIKSAKSFSTRLMEARHPVVETALEAGEFTPNSTGFTKNSYLHLVTGPNMAGKSTYIRQVALIQILAQIGSFVPAYEAEISIVDGIYTRIGAGDALAEGLSTFMVEMIETARILHSATSNSLIILDEVGRGTSTVDGMSIAQAVVEYIHNKIKAKALFATHFHELTHLEQRLKKLTNLHVKVSEKNGRIKFLHKIEKGGTDRSYGVDVAKLAGVPEEVVERARTLLRKSQSDQLKLSL